jgi:hypothetical protein
MGKKTINELSIDSKVLFEALSEVEPGAICPYAALSDRIGRDVQREARGNLDTAVRLMRNEQGVVFDTVRGVGLKRLHLEGWDGIGQRAIVSIRNAGRRAVTKLNLAPLGDLDREQKTRVLAASSVLETVRHFSKPAQVQKLDRRVEADGKPLPVGKVLEVMR